MEAALAAAASLTVVNRDTDRCDELAQLIRGHTPAHAEAIAWDRPYRVPEETDTVINATSIGLYPDIDPRLHLDLDSLRPHMVVADVIPTAPWTALLHDTDARGCRTRDGLGMLVNQGVISIKLWTGTDADPDVMRHTLAELFGA